MFSQKVEYALRAMVHLAAEAPAARTVEQIANATKVPQAYLAKVVQELVHGGVARSQRGIGGGISLARLPADVTMLEVVNAVDPIRRSQCCPLDLVGPGVRLCSLHRRIDHALALVEDAFRSTTLAEIIAESAASVPTCDFPALKNAT